MLRGDKKLTIEGKPITLGGKPYCIAEVGINHNGSLERALQMVDVAREVGADAVKFQTFSAEELCGDPTQLFTYKSQGQSVTEPMLDMFRRNELNPDDWRHIKAHCVKVGITFFSTPQNVSDLELLVDVGVNAIKVGSDDLTNLPLLRRYASFGLPMILSCGMADIADVHAGLMATGWYDGADVAMLLCTSQYPTPPEDVNISKFDTLINGFDGLIVGFSDHTQGTIAAAMAIAKGAVIFEKHFTLDKNSEGPDHFAPMDPAELKILVFEVRQLENMLSIGLQNPFARKAKNIIRVQKSLLASHKICKGDVFLPASIVGKGRCSGILADQISKIIGSPADQNCEKGDFI